MSGIVAVAGTIFALRHRTVVAGGLQGTMFALRLVQKFRFSADLGGDGGILSKAPTSRMWGI